jgi:hypothetical protein
MAKTSSVKSSPTCSLEKKNRYHLHTSKVARSAWHKWLISIILATWETEIKRIMVGSQPRKIVYETLSPKIPCLASVRS